MGGADGPVAGARSRIAIVDKDRCKPSKCKQECRKFCPVVRSGKPCVDATSESKCACISESLCIGCGICTKKCPFEAISIINLPRDLAKDTIHRWGPNSFKLHRLPAPRAGHVLGLVGTNGIGKSTALLVLAGKVKPNLGKYDVSPDWIEILAHIRGGELHSYFQNLLENKYRVVMKPQYVDMISKSVNGTVETVLEQVSKCDDAAVDQDSAATGEAVSVEECVRDLELEHLGSRAVRQLSGGELQRFAIALCCVQQASVYMFDEPSSYLDVRQRIRAAHTIRALQTRENYIVVVEHDLAVLDYLSDYVCCLWGQAGAYGVVTMPFTVREGINIFLDGYIPTENLRFRDVSLTFKLSEEPEREVDMAHRTVYPRLLKKLGNFELDVSAGDFAKSEINVLLGQNGTGKTTLIRLLAGHLEPDERQEADALPALRISYKPQLVNVKFEGKVQDLLMLKVRDMYVHPQFQADVTRPMLIDQIADRDVQTLSGGELQRLTLVLTLGRPADMYLLDEPSAYLDVEQRVVTARVIKRFILHARRTAFIVEHDFLMATYLADRVIVYEGTPGVRCTASAPMSLLEGMNKFLAQLEITFRRDPKNYRPRINKAGSAKDREQKACGAFFVLED